MAKKLALGIAFLILFFFIYPSTKAESLIPQLIYQKNGVSSNQLTGIYVAGAGDVNSDGYADFLIGTTFGVSYLYSGMTGEEFYQKTGATIAGIGDINGDGRADFITGRPGVAPAGSAFIYSGVDGNLLYVKDGTNSGDAFGTSVAGAGDVNQDGINDFIIGAERVDSGALTDVGAAYIYSGATGELLYQKFGRMAYERFGWSVGSVEI